MVKKVFLGVVNTISVIIIVFAVIVLLVVVMTPKGQAPSILGYSFFRVMTGSMEPEMPVNSLIVVEKTPVQDLEPGDVISFYSRDPSLAGEVNTHRIVDISDEEGTRLFQTKGDANNVPDRYITREEDVIGKVVFTSLFAGKLIRLASNPVIFLPFIVLPMAIMLIYSIYKSYRIAKTMVQEEEEAAVREAIEMLRKKKEDERNG